MSALSLAKQFALEMNDALKQSDLTKFSEIMNNSWEQKKKFVNGISDQRIDNICKKIFSAGASAAKVTGAGGGGHIFVYAEKAKHKLFGGALTRNVSYPAKLGYWPAFIFFLAFAWLEINWPGASSPSKVATALTIYSVITFIGMLI